MADPDPLQTFESVVTERVHDDDIGRLETRRLPTCRASFDRRARARPNAALLYSSVRFRPKAAMRVALCRLSGLQSLLWRRRSTSPDSCIRLLPYLRRVSGLINHRSARWKCAVGLQICFQYFCVFRPNIIGGLSLSRRSSACHQLSRPSSSILGYRQFLPGDVGLGYP